MKGLAVPRTAPVIEITPDGPPRALAVLRAGKGRASAAHSGAGSGPGGSQAAAEGRTPSSAWTPYQIIRSCSTSRFRTDQPPIQRPWQRARPRGCRWRWTARAWNEALLFGRGAASDAGPVPCAMKEW